MRALLLAMFLAACVDADPLDEGDNETVGDGLDGDGKADGASGAGAPGQTHLLTLASGAFPGSGHTDAVVYQPAGFDPAAPVEVVVFLHGWNNCAANVIRSVGIRCTPGRPVRQPYALAAQLEASGKHALLVVPELSYDAATGDPGALGEPGAFRAFLDEVLAALELGGVDDLRTVVVISHSGGYRAAAAFARDGGVPIDELYLLDSLYGHTDDFDRWIEDDHDLFVAPRARRFGIVYSWSGGTRADSQAMATRAAGWFAAAPRTVHDDRTTATWTAASYDRGLLFKRSGLGHEAIPRYYVQRLLLTGGLGATAPR